MLTVNADLLQEVITSNRERQRKAREINRRAGKQVFLVMSQDELANWLHPRLAGARCTAEVRNPAGLALPALDEDQVASVLRDNPDAIEVLGSQLAVAYTDAYGCSRTTPQVRLSDETVKANGWIHLPDEGVKLPGGRSVEVVVSFGYYDTVSSQNIPELKVHCASNVNQSQWDNWPNNGRPIIALPDPADAAAVVPEITEVSYGTSVVDGSPLLAYGIAVVKSYRYSSDPWFEGKWFQMRADAERARAEAVAKLESIREETIQQKRLTEALAAAQETRTKLQSLLSHKDWYELDANLRSRVDQWRYAYLPSGVDELHAWTREVSVLIGEVEAAFTAKAEAKAAEERRIADAERSGYLLRKLEVTCDTRYGRGRVWVIRPDGTLRDHDGYGSAGSRRYTCYAWNLISDELVLVHGVESVTGVEVSLTLGTGIVWRPRQVTQAQIVAVEKIEGENELGGTFEVDPGLVAKRAKMMDEIRKEIVLISPNENVQGLRFLDVSGGEGHRVNHDDPRRLVNLAAPFTAGCEGREAQVVRSVRCAGGVLEFLLYEKWGQSNLNARWRPLSEEEKATPPPAESKTADPKQVDLSKLFGGGGKFRNK